MIIEENKSVLDKWSIIHSLVGYIAGKKNINFKWFLTAIISYEIFEYAIEYPHGSKIFGTVRPESGVNLISDLVLGVVFYKLGNK